MKKKSIVNAAGIFTCFLLVLWTIGPSPLAAEKVQGTGSGVSYTNSAASEQAAQATKANAKLNEKLKKFRLFMNTEMKRWEVPGMGIGIVKDGKVVFAEGFGFRNLEKKLPVTPNTLFAIGSASKAFTTMDVGILVDEGKIEWDKPVRTYLPEFQLKDEIATERMTVRDLVCHRSGLPRHDALWYGSPISREGLIKSLRYLDFSADFRATFQYNNLMYATAGYIVGKQSNSSWEEFTRKRVFELLGMTNSNFSVEDSKKSDDHSQPYIKRDNVVTEVPFRNIDNIGPAGSINSCVNDMLKWVQLHLNKGKAGDKQIISEAGQKEMYTPAMAMREPTLTIQPEGQSDMSYGLGWFLETYRGHKVVHHGGAIDGFYFLNGYLPQDGLGVVVLSNLSGTPLVQMSMGYIVDMMLDLDLIWEKLSPERFDKAKKDQEKAEERRKKREAERVQGTKPSHSFEAYAGVYEHPAYGEVTVEFKDNALTGKYRTLEFSLEHWHYDVFKAVDNKTKSPDVEGLQMNFQTNSRGDIDRLSIPLEAAVAPILFTKKAPEEMKDPKFLSQFAGEYEVMGMIITIFLKGNALFASIPSQPTIELVPYKGTEFILKGLESYRIKFILEQGKVTEIEVNQAGATFRGKKK